MSRGFTAPVEGITNRWCVPGETQRVVQNLSPLFGVLQTAHSLSNRRHALKFFFFSTTETPCPSMNSESGTCYHKLFATPLGRRGRQRLRLSGWRTFILILKSNAKAYFRAVMKVNWIKPESNVWAQHLCGRFAAVFGSFATPHTVVWLNFIANQRKSKTPKHKYFFTHD